MSNFWEYLKERFPPFTNSLLIFSLFLANYSLAYLAARQKNAGLFSLRFIGGFIILELMFFHLRVIDEHKDDEIDLAVYPDRVLSRGLVTLSQLRKIGFFAITIELVLSLILGLPVLIGCILVLILSWLIYKEFYLEEFLHKHILLNAFIHMSIMPVYGLFVYSVAANKHLWSAPSVVLRFAAMSYFVGLGFEIARKVRAPEDERPDMVTYSKPMGPVKAALSVLAAFATASSIGVNLGSVLNFRPWYPLELIILMTIIITGVYQYSVNPTAKNAKRLQDYAGISVFIVNWGIVVEIINIIGLG